jgi:DNA-binding transcriptional ArsR family regulator
MSLGVAGEPVDESAETGALRAYAHPLRLRMLSLLTGAPMSAAELSRELDITHANASYHLRVLARAGFVVVAEEREVRGGLERRYAISKSEPTRVDDPAARRQWFRVLAEELVRRSADEVRPRRNDPRAVSADAELWVSREVWADVVARIHEAVLDLHEAAQPPRTRGTIRTSTTVAMFGMTR